MSAEKKIYHYYLLRPREALGLVGERFFHCTIKDKSVKNVKIDDYIYKSEQIKLLKLMVKQRKVKEVKAGNLNKKNKKVEEKETEKGNEKLLKVSEYLAFSKLGTEKEYKKFEIESPSEEYPGINFYWNDELCFIEMFKPSLKTACEIFKSFLTQKPPYTFLLPDEE